MSRVLKKSRANAKILLADNDSVIRQGLRNALAHEGYKDVHAVGKISVLREIVANKLVDLLIVDAETPEGDAIDLVTDIRRNRLGKNPFLPVILVTWDANRAAIGRAANSGVDYILMKPIAPVQLFSRIDGLVCDRKPFVATINYVGPERRERERWGDTRHFDVPNTLRDKIDGKPVDLAAIAEQAGSIMREMNESRLEMAARYLVHTVEEVCGAYEQGAASAAVDKAFASIMPLAKKIGALASGDIATLSTSLVRIVEPMGSNMENADGSQLEILRPLSQSILLAASADLEQPAVMEEISRAVSRFAPKKRLAAGKATSAV